MNFDRIPHLLQRMYQAASEAHSMIEKVDKEAFRQDMVLQRAVGMSLLMASEIATQLLTHYPEFTAEHPEFPWEAMRGMRNRIANEYFDIDLERVWEAARNDVPDLLARLDLVRHWRAEGE